MALRDGLELNAQQIAADLDRTGFVCIHNAVNGDWLSRAQADVKHRIEEFGAKYFSVVCPGDEVGSPAEEIVEDFRLQHLMRELTEITCTAGVANYEEVYNVLRVIAGPDGAKGSLEFHYDASVVTVLVPIFIPQGDTSGEGSGALVTFANRRPYRSLPVNLIEKFFVQNKRYAKIITRRFERDPEPHTQLLEPGNIYVFWGYRTLHGNLKCAPNALRATMLLHYGNPHGSNPVLNAIRDIRKKVETKRRVAVDHVG